MAIDKQQERLGTAGKSTPLRDNLDLDVIDAQAMGYGVHYGQFKADHPFTKDANEARLAPTPKSKQKVYEFTCRGCGEKFTTTIALQRYCGENCKAKKNNANYRAKQGQKEMEV